MCEKNLRKESERMLRATIEELSALSLVLQFTTVEALLDAAMKGFVDKENEEDITMSDKEISDLCWKVLKTLR
jgi:hypothetical protein